jgi:hypothetical protein
LERGVLKGAAEVTNMMTNAQFCFQVFSQPPVRQHFADRFEQRRLRPAVLSFILAWGTEWRARGATHMTVLWRSLPASLRDTRIAHAARDWVVLMDDDGSLLTCYRRSEASRFLRRKPKRRLSPAELAVVNRRQVRW